jgi:hypothetical protein
MVLFCAGGIGDSLLRFGTAANLADATARLGGPSRMPSTTEMKVFWKENKLSERDTAEVAAEYGVSRQTVAHWALRAGAAESSNRHKKRAVVIKLLKAGKTIAQVAKDAGVTVQTVYRVANAHAITPAKAKLNRNALYTPEELIAAATGKTWDETAAALRVKTGTLRNFASRHDLTAKLREVMVRAAPGPKKKAKRQRLQHAEVDTIISMLRDGTEPKEIAKALGLRLAVVNYWLLKGKKVEA